MENIIELIKWSCGGFWRFIGAYGLIGMFLYFTINFTLRIVSRILRVINITINGYPPTHLDADGDFKEEIKK